MSQWVSLLLAILFNEIRNVEVDMPTEITTLEPYRVRLQVASIFASVFFEGIYYSLNNITCEK